jgi:hypothetical protein
MATNRSGTAGARSHVVRLKRSAFWFYVGLASVVVNLILLTVLLVLGKL